MEAIAALTQLIDTLGDETREPVAQAVQLAHQMREDLMREHPQSDDQPL
jgi:hypothetical protein